MAARPISDLTYGTRTRGRVFRLNRALEELEKYKTLMRERQVEEQDKKMDIKREVERLARGMMLQSFFDGPHLSLHTLELTMAR